MKPHSRARSIAALCLGAGMFMAHGQEYWATASPPGNVFSLEQLYNDTLNDRLICVGAVSIDGDSDLSDNAVLIYQDGTWDTLLIGSFTIQSAIMYEDKLILGGTTFSANDNLYQGVIAFADGIWSYFGSIDGTVRKLRIIDGVLYAVGSFSTANGVTCNGIAKRVGNQWTNVGILGDPNSPIIGDIVSYNGELVAAGSVSVNGDPDGGVIRFNGTSWEPLGGGIVGGLGHSLAVFKEELYVGGLFPIGPNPGKAIMKWNGTEWRSLGVGPQVVNGSYQFDYQIQDLLVHDSTLFVAGGFRYVSGVPADVIATYDGLNWCGFGGDLSPAYPQSIGFYHDTLFMSQSEYVLWGDSVNKLIRFISDSYADTCGSLQVGMTEQQTDVSTRMWWNNGILTIHGLPSSEHLLRICDPQGRWVYQARLSPDGNAQKVISIPDLPPGTYAAWVESGPFLKFVVD